MTDYQPPKLKRSAGFSDAPRFELFTITDETTSPPTERTFSMPWQQDSGLALRFLRKVDEVGGEVAGAWLLEQAIGAQAFAALTSQRDLSDEDIKAISQAASRIVTGKLLPPKPAAEPVADEADPFEAPASAGYSTD